MSLCLSLFSRATITKHHRLVDLNNRNLFSHSSKNWNSEVKLMADFLSPEAFLLGSQMSPFLGVLLWSFLCTQRSLVSLCVSKSVLIRTPFTLD